MRTTISRLQQRLKVPPHYVNHGPERAMTLGQTGSLGYYGRKLNSQVGRPASALRPTGQPVRGGYRPFTVDAYELVPGELNDGHADWPLGDVPAARPDVAPKAREQEKAQRGVSVGIRPEDLEDAAASRAVPSARREPR